MINLIRKYLGWRNGAVFQYNSIFENLFILFSILLFTGKTNTVILIDILIFFIFSILSTSYGYLINDFADRELDLKHQKPNTFENDSKTKAVWVVSIVFFLSLIAGVRFIQKPYFPVLWLGWFLISTFYSLKPFRFKERGPAGLLSAVIAQRFIPVLMVFSIWGSVSGKFMIAAVLYVFFRGLSSDLNHQLDDYNNDKQTHTSTFAVKAGLERGTKILRFSLEMEKVLLPVVMICPVWNCNKVNPLGCWLYAGLILLYFLAYFFSVLRLLQKKDTDVNPFRNREKTIFQFLHHSYPSVILPIGLNGILSIWNPVYLITLGIQLWIRNLFSINVTKQSFIYSIIKRG